MSSYHNYNCCDLTRGTDALLARYTSDRAEVTELLANNPEKLVKTIWQKDGPLANDSDCLCQMGQGDIRSSFSCASCKSLRRIIDFKLGGISRPFRLECGKEIGKTLIVLNSAENNFTPFLTWDGASAEKAKQYVKQYKELLVCGTPDVSSLRCISGDPFTIRTLITWQIAKVFSEKSLPHAASLYTAFVCRNQRYSLCEVPSLGSFEDLHKHSTFIEENLSAQNVRAQATVRLPLKSEVAGTIILQLLVVLKELLKINFSHGTPTRQSLIFSKDPVSYVYDGVKIVGPLTLQLSNLWHSSATVNNVHYFSRDLKHTMHLEKGLFVPTIVTKKVMNCTSTCSSQQTEMYRLTNSTVDIFHAMRHIGFPLYTGSFDLYAFFTSLMCDQHFFDAVLQDKKLYQLWNALFLPEDIANVEILVKQSHSSESSSLENPINIIRGAWLRCDAVNYVWSIAKQLS